MRTELSATSVKKNIKKLKAITQPKKTKKEPKPPKKKVDRSDPNWKLKPNEKVNVLLKVGISEFRWHLTCFLIKKRKSGTHELNYLYFNCLHLFQDPMFDNVRGKDSNKGQTAPYVSSVVESRLLIAAVICNDMNLLKALKVIRSS